MCLENGIADLFSLSTKGGSLYRWQPLALDLFAGLSVMIRDSMPLGGCARKSERYIGSCSQNTGINPYDFDAGGCIVEAVKEITLPSRSDEASGG